VRDDSCDERRQFARVLFLLFGWGRVEGELGALDVIVDPTKLENRRRAA
jgi:hypothetical protein